MSRQNAHRPATCAQVLLAVEAAGVKEASTAATANEFHSRSECLVEQFAIHACLSSLRGRLRLVSSRTRASTEEKSALKSDSSPSLKLSSESEDEGSVAAQLLVQQDTAAAATGACTAAEAAAADSSLALASGPNSSPNMNATVRELLDAVWETIDARLAHLQSTLSAPQLSTSAQCTRQGTLVQHLNLPVMCKYLLEQ